MKKEKVPSFLLSSTKKKKTLAHFLINPSLSWRNCFEFLNNFRNKLWFSITLDAWEIYNWWKGSVKIVGGSQKKSCKFVSTAKCWFAESVSKNQSPIQVVAFICSEQMHGSFFGTTEILTSSFSHQNSTKRPFLLPAR